jgi:hypothetical protein
MPTDLHQRKVARVLFDESHGEAWTIRPEVARRMHAEHPGDASYVRVAEHLAARDFEVAAHTDGPLDDEALTATDVLVVAHPSAARRERTVRDGAPLFSQQEIGALERFVSRGGGLVVLGETVEERHGGNLNELLAPYGVRLESTTVTDHAADGVEPMDILGEPTPDADAPTLLHLVHRLRLSGAGSLAVERSTAVAVRASAEAQPPQAGLLAATEHGEGRVVVVADSDLFGDDHIVDLDHLQLWHNIVYWVSLAAFRSEPERIDSEAAQDAAWTRLRDETDALRRLQEPTGEVDLEEHDLGEVAAHVTAMIESIGDLASRFPHESRYLTQVSEDLRMWIEDGCGKPDFTASLALFRPEQHRRDGVEHLAVFPMYTPNGSPDVRFEALIVRTPWPSFIDELERTRYHNDKFVPVQLVDHTAGYASECAVLFPETVSVVGRPTNHFGGIFCDRESGRYRRTMGEATGLLKIDLPPDAEALTASGDLALHTYILWDLIHDSWHSHGDLPFDPFMIRQRLPFWMYSLEELRVDLSAFVDAGKLAREGFPFARYVQYAMLFDRILRFPITGDRVRNYDGLGGQLLFAYLHKTGVVRWTDNRLLVDWERVEAAVTELRDKVEDLYRRGIDLSKVSYWIAAHDLVSDYVEPNVLSAWRRDRRVYSDEADTRAWIDRVNNDEFPLSTFYLSWQKKLGDRLAQRAEEAARVAETGRSPVTRGDGTRAHRAMSTPGGMTSSGAADSSTPAASSAPGEAGATSDTTKTTAA